MPQNHYLLDALQHSRLPAAIKSAINTQLTAVSLSPIGNKPAIDHLPILTITLTIDQTGLNYTLNPVPFDKVQPPASAKTVTFRRPNVTPPESTPSHG